MFSLAPEYNHKLKQIKTPGGRNLTAVTASARTIYVNVSTGALLSGFNTTRATDGSNGGPNQANGALSADVALAAWPKTPAACDGEGGTFDVMKAIRENLNPKAKLRDWALVAGFGTPNQTDDQQSRMGQKAKAKALAKKNGFSALWKDAEICGWATATAMDARGARNATSGRSNPDSKHHAGETLNDQILGVILPLFFVPTGRRVVLAPEFSLWLMGYPEAWATAAPGAKDWREAQAALELECSREAETPSSPNLPPSS